MALSLLLRGLGLAFSSIIGAGIVFVPANLLYYAGDAAVGALLGGFGLSILFGLLFARLAVAFPDTYGLEAVVLAAFGDRMRRVIPLCIALALVLGLPIAAWYAAILLQGMLPGLGAPMLALCLVLFAISFLSNIVGFRLASSIQLGVVLVMAVVMAQVITSRFDEVVRFAQPGGLPVRDLSAGLLIVVLAFAGLENMPAVSHTFQGRNKTYLASMALGSGLSLLVYCAIVGVLKDDVSAIGEPTDARVLSWILGDQPNEVGAVGLVLGALVVLAILGNIITWNIGLTRALGVSVFASRVSRPLFIQLILLAVYSAVTLALAYGVLPIQSGLTQVAAVFASVYALFLVAFIRCERSPIYRALGLVGLAAMGAVLFSNRWYIAAPGLLIAATVWANARTETRPDRAAVL